MQPFLFPTVSLSSERMRHPFLSLGEQTNYPGWEPDLSGLFLPPSSFQGFLVLGTPREKT